MFNFKKSVIIFDIDIYIDNMIYIVNMMDAMVTLDVLDAGHPTRPVAESCAWGAGQALLSTHYVTHGHTFGGQHKQAINPLKQCRVSTRKWKTH